MALNLKLLSSLQEYFKPTLGSPIPQQQQPSGNSSQQTSTNVPSTANVNYYAPPPIPAKKDLNAINARYFQDYTDPVISTAQKTRSEATSPIQINRNNNIDPIDCSTHNTNQFKSSVVSTSTLSVEDLVNGHVSTKVCLKRRVKFLDTIEGKHLVTGSLPPRVPFDRGPETTINHHEIVAAYVAACKQYNVNPLLKVEKQIGAWDFAGLRRQEVFSLRGEKMSVNQLDCLETVFQRVQFYTVDFEYTFLDDDSTIALMDMIEYYDSAVCLNLSFNQHIGLRGWQSVYRLIRKSPSLQELNLRYTSLTERFVPFLARALRSEACLRTLHLENCNLSGKSLLILVQALKMNKTVKELYLGENNLGPNDAVHLYHLIVNNTCLELLDLRNNLLGNEGVSHICDGLTHKACRDDLKLSHLVLWNNRLTAGSMEFIGRVLMVNVSLLTLNLGSNPVGSEGIVAVKDALTRNRSLLRIGLQAIKLTDQGAIAVAECIADNTVLVRVDLRENPEVKLAGLLALHLALRMNENITALNLDRTCTVANNSKMRDYGDEFTRIYNEIQQFCRRNVDLYSKKLREKHAADALAAANNQESPETREDDIGGEGQSSESNGYATEASAEHTGLLINSVPELGAGANTDDSSTTVRVDEHNTRALEEELASAMADTIIAAVSATQRLPTVALTAELPSSKSEIVTVKPAETSAIGHVVTKSPTVIHFTPSPVEPSPHQSVPHLDSPDSPSKCKNPQHQHHRTSHVNRQYLSESLRPINLETVEFSPKHTLTDLPTEEYPSTINQCCAEPMSTNSLLHSTAHPMNNASITTSGSITCDSLHDNDAAIQHTDPSILENPPNLSAAAIQHHQPVAQSWHLVAPSGPEPPSLIAEVVRSVIADLMSDVVDLTDEWESSDMEFEFDSCVQCSAHETAASCDCENATCNIQGLLLDSVEPTNLLRQQHDPDKRYPGALLYGSTASLASNSSGQAMPIVAAKLEIPDPLSQSYDETTMPTTNFPRYTLKRDFSLTCSDSIEAFAERLQSMKREFSKSKSIPSGGSVINGSVHRTLSESDDEVGEVSNVDGSPNDTASFNLADDSNDSDSGSELITECSTAPEVSTGSPSHQMSSPPNSEVTDECPDSAQKRLTRVSLTTHAATVLPRNIDARVSRAASMSLPDTPIRSVRNTRFSRFTVSPAQLSIVTSSSMLSDGTSPATDIRPRRNSFSVHDTAEPDVADDNPPAGGFTSIANDAGCGSLGMSISGADSGVLSSTHPMLALSSVGSFSQAATIHAVDGARFCQGVSLKVPRRKGRFTVVQSPTDAIPLLAAFSIGNDAQQNPVTGSGGSSSMMTRSSTGAEFCSQTPPTIFDGSSSCNSTIHPTVIGAIPSTPVSNTGITVASPTSSHVATAISARSCSADPSVSHPGETSPEYEHSLSNHPNNSCDTLGSVPELGIPKKRVDDTDEYCGSRVNRAFRNEVIHPAQSKSISDVDLLLNEVDAELNGFTGIRNRFTEAEDTPDHNRNNNADTQSTGARIDNLIDFSIKHNGDSTCVSGGDSFSGTVTSVATENMSPSSTLITNLALVSEGFDISNNAKGNRSAESTTYSIVAHRSIGREAEEEECSSTFSPRRSSMTMNNRLRQKFQNRKHMIDGPETTNVSGPNDAGTGTSSPVTTLNSSLGHGGEIHLGSPLSGANRDLPTTAVSYSSNRDSSSTTELDDADEVAKVVRLTLNDIVRFVEYQESKAAFLSRSSSVRERPRPADDRLNKWASTTSVAKSISFNGCEYADDDVNNQSKRYNLTSLRWNPNITNKDALLSERRFGSLRVNRQNNTPPVPTNILCSMFAKFSALPMPESNIIKKDNNNNNNNNNNNLLLPGLKSNAEPLVDVEEIEQKSGSAKSGILGQNSIHPVSTVDSATSSILSDKFDESNICATHTAMEPHDDSAEPLSSQANKRDTKVDQSSEPGASSQSKKRRVRKRKQKRNIPTAAITNPEPPPSSSSSSSSSISHSNPPADSMHRSRLARRQPAAKIAVDPDVKLVVKDIINYVVYKTDGTL